jgi:hypothetical protein
MIYGIIAILIIAALFVLKYVLIKRIPKVSIVDLDKARTELDEQIDEFNRDLDIKINGIEFDIDALNVISKDHDE